MNFTAAIRAGETRRLSTPGERLNMARSLLRPRLLDAGLVDAASFNAGHADGLAGRKWQITEAHLKDPARQVENLSYMLGYKAGELARRGGADPRGLAGGGRDPGGGDGH